MQTTASASDGVPVHAHAPLAGSSRVGRGRFSSDQTGGQLDAAAFCTLRRQPWASTRRTAVAAISANGCRTVVSGGEVQRERGRSSKPMRLSWIRHLHVLYASGFEHAQGLNVAARKNGRWRLRQRQHGHRLIETAVHMEVTPLHERRVEGQPGRLHGRPVTVHARPAAKQVRGADEITPTPVVPQFDQVASGREPTGPVGGADGGHAGVRFAAGVDDGEG